MGVGTGGVCGGTALLVRVCALAKRGGGLQRLPIRRMEQARAVRVEPWPKDCFGQIRDAKSIIEQLNKVLGKVLGECIVDRRVGVDSDLSGERVVA